MAIEKSLEHLGATYPSAYAMVWQVQIFKDTLRAEIGVRTYNDSTKAHLLNQEGYTVQNIPAVRENDVVVTQPSQPLTTYMVDSKVKPSGKSPWVQAYAYLKTMPEFTGGTDV